MNGYGNFLITSSGFGSLQISFWIKVPGHRPPKIEIYGNMCLKLLKQHILFTGPTHFLFAS